MLAVDPDCCARNTVVPSDEPFGYVVEQGTTLFGIELLELIAVLDVVAVEMLADTTKCKMTICPHSSPAAIV